MVDWTNETPFDVITQRHRVLIQEMAREEKEFREAQAQEEQLLALENDVNLAYDGSMEQGQEDLKIVDEDANRERDLPVESQPVRTSEATRAETEQQEGAVGGDGAAVPGEAAAAPVGEAGEAGGADEAAEAAAAGTAEASATIRDGVPAPGHDEELGGTSGSVSGGTLGTAPSLNQLPGGGVVTKDQLVLQRHQKRLQELIDREKEEKRIEQVLTRDRFLDVLASKISEKMICGPVDEQVNSPLRGNAELVGQNARLGRGGLLRAMSRSYAIRDVI